MKTVSIGVTNAPLVVCTAVTDVVKIIISSVTCGLFRFENALLIVAIHVAWRVNSSREILII